MSGQKNVAGSRTSEVQLLPPLPQEQQEQDFLAAEQLSDGKAVGGTNPVAVIAIHGIGQQVPFEMIETVATILKLTQERSDDSKGTCPPIGVRFTPVGNGEFAQVLPRAELTVTDHSRPGCTCQVHLYDAYWAPITEARVGLWDTIKFLFDAARRGLQSRWRGQFSRRVFSQTNRGEVPVWQLSPNPTWSLLLVLSTLCSLLFMSLVAAAIGMSDGLFQFRSEWPPAALVADLTMNFWLLIFALAPFGVLFALGSWHRTRHMRRLDQSYKQGERPYFFRLSSVSWFTMYMSLGFIIFTGVLTFLHLLYHRDPPSEPPWWRDVFWQRFSLPMDWLSGFASLIPWLFVVGLTSTARWWLVQFMGDTAAYVSAHKVHQFQKIRAEIQQEVLRIARAVYSDQLQDKDGSQFHYQRVIVLAHSLGSVIGYDMLNLLIQTDSLNADDTSLHVAKRTPLFLTCGSPLDKIAYIFRNHHVGKPDSPDVRESLAEARQPLIQNYGFRPQQWVNVWSRFDPIAGPLDFYDYPEDFSHHAQSVINIEDREACTPIASHGEYFDGRTLGDVFYNAVTGRPL